MVHPLCGTALNKGSFPTVAMPCSEMLISKLSILCPDHTAGRLSCYSPRADLRSLRHLCFQPQQQDHQTAFFAPICLHHCLFEWFVQSFRKLSLPTTPPSAHIPGSEAAGREKPRLPDQTQSRSAIIRSGISYSFFPTRT